MASNLDFGSVLDLVNSHAQTARDFGRKAADAHNMAIRASDEGERRLCVETRETYLKLADLHASLAQAFATLSSAAD